jgi:hypothetical protein
VPLRRMELTLFLNVLQLYSCCTTVSTSTTCSMLPVLICRLLNFKKYVRARTPIQSTTSTAVPVVLAYRAGAGCGSGCGGGCNGGDGAVLEEQLGATDAVGAGVQRGVCGLGRRVAHAGARLLIIYECPG